MKPIVRQLLLIILNDLRLSLRGLVAEKWRSGLTLIILIFIFGFLHVASAGYFVAAQGLPDNATQSAVWALVGFVMTVAGLNHSLRVMTNPTDLDLLLSSPVAHPAILGARIAGATAAALFATAFIVVPILNGATLVLGGKSAWGYLVWLLLGVTAAGISSGITSWTVQLTGSTRALGRAQVAATVVLALVGFAFQSRTLLPVEIVSTASELMQKILGIPGARLPALGGQGHAGALIALGCGAAMGTAFATLCLSKSLTSGLREPVNATQGNSRPQPFAFVTNPAIAAVRKDLRLITRDALLLSRVLPFALFALPGFFLAGRALQTTVPVILSVYTAFAVVVMSTQLGKVSAEKEECWELIGQSPASPLVQPWMKVAACMVLPLSIGAISAVAIAVLKHPGLALMSIGTALVSGIGATWVEISDVRPARQTGVMATSRNPDAATPARLVAAFVFVLMGPLGLGLIGHGIAVVGFGILAVCLVGALLTCGFMRPRTTGS